MERKIMLDVPKKIIKGFISAWILISLGILGAGLVLLLTPVSLQTGSYIIIASASAGGFLCGAAVSSAVGRRGLIAGAAAGAVLSLTILAAYLLFFGAGVENSLNLLPLALPAGTGAAGGIYGVSGIHGENSRTKK